MTAFADQTGRTVFLLSPLQRIISLVPSQTELLADLGLQEEVIGITKFCIHPSEWFRNKKRIGGTKLLNMELIHQLQPDLILANKEENVKEQVEELAAHFPVWTSDIHTLEGAYDMIREIGSITGKSDAAARIIAQVKAGFAALPVPPRKPKAAYLIWKSPYMTVGNDTFIHSMLDMAGYENVFANSSRYPVITIEELQASACEYLFLSSEPYPFSQKHIDELQPFLPDTKILLVDGEMFSWYGSRLIHAPAYFKSLTSSI
ncbi:MAG: ABC transporter substrate-binding protein [Sphingobacteriales bacterium]|nr:ABC transporter substrate-binding protein [Sphingobacteriales bacterium]OJV97708.1 MAG: cobalamin-binding protein [Sphingobacteriales bacterium 44-61]